MSKLNELKEQRTKLLLDAQKIVIKKDALAEERASAKVMIADADTLDEQIALEERIAKNQTEQRSNGNSRPPRAQPGEGIPDEKREADERNFVHYMRTGEIRDLQTGTTGAPFVPQGFSTTLTEAAKLWGQLASSVKQMRTATGEPMRIPLANDTGNAFSLLGESQPVTELDPTLSGVLSQVDKIQGGIVKVSREMLADSAFDLASWLSGEFSKRYWRGVSAAVRNGTSTGNVAAITSVAVAGVTTASPTAILYPELAEMYGALEAAYIPGASWVMSSATRAYFLGVEDNYGRPLYVPSVNTDNLDRILGLPVVIDQYAPAIGAGLSPILLGNLTEAYTLRSVGDVEVIRLNERYSDTYEVGFQAFTRVSGFGTDAGTHPLIKLTMHA
jgi:HK97 family phage major capsid protein